MTRKLTSLAICGLAMTMLSLDVVAQKKVPVSRAENGLVGIKLYDSGARVIAVYGSPLEIQAVGAGAAAIGPGGGARGGAPGAQGGGGGPQVGSSSASSSDIRPLPGVGEWGFGNDMLNQVGFGDEDMGNPRGGGQMNPRGGGVPRGGGTTGGGGGGVGGATQAASYTRWVYKRGMSKYGFILDQSNRVVQIEAIGLNDGRVKTSRGVRFGTQFKDLIKRYGTPDGYEIGGDSIVVRFLRNSKVAFRLNRLAKDKPHQVTGIVVAGGKV